MDMGGGGFSNSKTIKRSIKWKEKRREDIKKVNYGGALKV
jgi:hypothetical protein